jgi:2-hydroxycyclohexanecarboxyl-CoA dehydrogenase
LTPSPMTEGVLSTPGVHDAFIKEYPLGRLNTCDDIAKAAIWIASDECYMTGQNFQVNGGLTLRRNPRPEEVAASVASAMESVI